MVFHTRFGPRCMAKREAETGETGVDNGIVEQGFAGIGAWILGRNMFGPFEAPGPTTAGKAGGAMNRPITRLSSC